MKLNDLSKIDIQTLQNITEEDIKLFGKQHATILINILLIAVTLFVIIFLFAGQSNIAAGLDKKLKELQEQKHEVEKGELVKKQYADKISFLPAAITNDELRNKISGIALESDVQIVSFEPKDEKQDDVVKISFFEMNILSKNYRNIMRFTANIEKIPNAVRVDKWSGKMEESVFKGQNIQTRESPITGTMTLSSVTLKENE